MFPGKLRRAIFAPFLGNSIYRAALQCLVFNSPPTISVTEGGIVVFSNRNWTPIPLFAWLRENTIQKLKILHKIDWFVNREEKKFPARKASWFDPGSPLHAMSLPPPFLSSYPTTCGWGLPPYQPGYFGLHAKQIRSSACERKCIAYTVLKENFLLGLVQSCHCIGMV